MNVIKLVRKAAFVVIFTVLSVAFLGGLYGHLNNLGWFEPWESLGKPPEKAIKISYTNEQPFVETSDGKIYLYSNSSSVSHKNHWTETDYSKLQIKESGPCYPVKPFDVPKPPGKIIDMVEFESCEIGLAVISATTIQHNFVLLEDGSVWAWKHANALPFFTQMGIVMHTIMGAGLGLILGVVLGVVVVVITIYHNLHKIDTA